MTKEERDKVIKVMKWLHDNDFLFKSTEEDVKYATELVIQTLEREPKTDIALARYKDLQDYFGDEAIAKTILENQTEFKEWLERLRWNTIKVGELARKLKALEQEPKTGHPQKPCDTCEYSDEINGNNCYECVKDMRNNYSPKKIEPKYCDRNICVSNEYNGIGCDECEVTKNQETYTDVISRQDALRAFMYATNGERLPDYDCDNYPVTYDLRCIKKTLRALPSVTPQPKMGHWIYKQYDGYPECGDYHCSECDKIDNRIPAYCPDCGARMVKP